VPTRSIAAPYVSTIFAGPTSGPGRASFFSLPENFQIDGARGDDWRTPYQAARWCFDNSVAPDEAAKWLEKSLAAQTTYANLGLKARWLQKDGKVADAVEAGRKAVELGKADPAKPDVSALEKSVTEWAASLPAGKKKAKK